jgi:hypothetical protein
MRTVNISLLLVTCVFVVACGPTQAELDAQATAIAADSFATQTAEAPTVTPTPVPPTATPTSTPTVTPTPQPAVRGTLIDLESDEPLVGARVLLCKVDSDGTQCTVDQQLVDITDEDGAFEIPVQPGEYAILYNTSGKSISKLSGRTLDYRETVDQYGFKGFFLKTLLLSVSGGASIPGSDLGGCMQTFLTDKGALLSGYLYYRPYDVGLVLFQNKLVSVKVEGGPAEIRLVVWDLKGPDPSCSDFNPYR